MKDEIKEIKDNLKINEYLDLIQEDKNLSMGYVSLAQYIYILECRITNLQEENERLKELVNPTTQIFIDTQDMEERYGQELYEDYLKKQLEDYKSRCEKAIEYIELWHYRNDYRVNSFTTGCKNDLLNILQGVGKDE